MSSFARAGALLAAGTLASCSPAMAATDRARVVKVPCSPAALAAAITAANTPAGATLRLTAGCAYGITTPATAATGLPVITGNVTLLGGPRTTISRNPSAAAFRIFDVVAGATLRVAGVSIRNGSTTGLGGGVQNAGTLILRNVTLAENTASNGGAVANIGGATATVIRALITANTTTGVGGGGILNSGSLTTYGTVLSVNTAPINGGGVNTQASGTTRLVRTTVEKNTSGSLGGGLSNLGTATLDRTLVHANRGSAGGGIASANTNVTSFRSIVRGNIPDDCSPSTLPACAR
jgi:hypothetical protein